MSIPEVKITVEDGALGTLPANVAGASVKIGVCSKGVPNSFKGYSDIKTMVADLGQGPLCEAVAAVLNEAGGPVYAVPANPSVAGSAGSVTHTGTGAGTVTPSLAPDRVILMKVTTGGTRGVALVSFSVDGAAYTTPVLTAATLQVPGTLTVLSLPTGTYVLNEVYTVPINGGAVTQTGSGPLPTQASSPLDAYDVLVAVVTAGTVAGSPAPAFTYSLDGGNTVSPVIAVPGSGVYTVPGSGVVLTFAGAFVVADTYRFATVAAGFSTSDANAAMDAILAVSTEWGFVHVVGTPANAAAAATLAAAMDVKISGAANLFRYAFAVVECPTSEADSVIAAAFAGVATTRVMVCVGDEGYISALTARTVRRNAAWPVTARLALIPADEDPAWVGRGALKGVTSLYRNEAATPLLDEARFTTLRTNLGKEGYFITNGRMMAPGGSDYTYVQFRRVMDVACRIVRAAELPFLNSDVRVDRKTGHIDERDAQMFEGSVNADLRAGVVAPGYASDASVVMSRTANLLAGASQPVTIRVLSKAYLKQIDTSIGFTNPASLAA